jgi:hypothetical protein
MGKHESIKDEPSGAAEALSALANDMSATPRMALAAIDPPDVETAIETIRSETAKLAIAAAGVSKIEALDIEAPKIELASTEIPNMESPRIAPDLDEPAPPNVDDAAPAESAAPESAAPRISRFTMLAAALALSAALGGMVGALGAASVMRSGPAPIAVAGRTGLEEIQALKENVVQARVELAALKVSIDSGARNASAQFTRIGERIERVERVQAEPAAKLTKAIDMLDRLARAEAAASSRDVTGSVTPPQTVAGGPSGKPGVVDGWVVRDVQRGTALIEGRAGLIEVDQGDVVPGLGRIDAIRKQDGRWVVVTSRGLITTGR